MWTFLKEYLYYNFYHRFYKWLMRLITGKCELLRIVSSNSHSQQKTIGVENSLRHSRYEILKRLLKNDDINIDDSVKDIVVLKKVKLDGNSEFPSQLKSCLQRIIGYRELLTEVEDTRKIAYSTDNPDHETLLLQLWSSLKPDVVLAGRISRQWTEIGFQGDDPATDFRGMGILGLKNLVYFATSHQDVARQVLSRSYHPQFGYSFAIVGINITSMAYHLLSRGSLKSHFYAAVQDQPLITDFHLVYVHLFYEFDKFWFAAKPNSIMEFNSVRDEFESNIIAQLEKDRLPFKFNFASVA